MVIMSCYVRDNQNVHVSIPKFVEASNGVTYYDIKVVVDNVEWMVERRYRDFDRLNEKLIEEIAISKKLLPPKKFVGNKSHVFLEHRRQQLENYMQELLVFFRIQLPHTLAQFLDFNRYDVIYVVQDLAQLFHESGDNLLSTKKEYNFSALEVYAISERIHLPCPPNSIERKGKFDFSYVLDFCSQLEILKITPVKTNNSWSGCNDYNSFDVPIGRSNIIPKNLKFTLNAFRNLKILKFYSLSMENIIDIGMLKPSLHQISVHNTTITAVNQVLLCDNIHKNNTLIHMPRNEDIALNSSTTTASISQNSSPLDSSAKAIWKNLKELNLSGNLITQIDESMRVVPKLKVLQMEQNCLSDINNLAELPHLQVLNLAANFITSCCDWHLKLGNLITLNLAQNKLKSLRGLSKLLSLVNLDLSCNLIDDLEEVSHIAGLPLLETLLLTGNPLAATVDYRPRVLARFHERAPEIVLDNEKGSHKELDTALVLSALHLSNHKRQKTGK